MLCQDQSAPEPLSGFIQYRHHGPTLPQWVQHEASILQAIRAIIAIASYRDTVYWDGTCRGSGGRCGGGVL
ncbi:hypothetical protein BT67DRAFT_292143 [Trichocladium antarcticum]|uniref:Uncharacterized protein n=1 Tax=Trichocladium antarcticum TaxID=1450529 RepID=A0AAN6ZEV8_9PEZI|nr:hypothetical protein BT67DRAFT_292143 [Trichocladium antarcticum]